MREISRRERLLGMAPVREAGEAVDERLPLDDAVEPRVLERDGRVPAEERRRLEVVGAELVADEDELAEALARPPGAASSIRSPRRRAFPS